MYNLLRKVVVFLALSTPAAAQTYTQLQFGIDRTATPYAFGAKIGAIWTDLGSVTAAGVWRIPSSNISGLGTAAVQNTGTSGANVPLLNAMNTFGAMQTFSNAADTTPVFKDVILRARHVTKDVTRGDIVPFDMISTDTYQVANPGTHFMVSLDNSRALGATGSRTTLISKATGGGSTSGEFNVGVQAAAVASTTYTNAAGNTAAFPSNSGTWVGMNSTCYLPPASTSPVVAAMASSSRCWGFESDVFLNNNVVDHKVGGGIADLGGGSGSSLDAGLVIFKSTVGTSVGTGFARGITFGHSGTPATNPAYGATGTLIYSEDVTSSILAGIDFSRFTKPFVDAAIKLTPGVGLGDIRWGTNGIGGAIKSNTTTGGGAVIFTNNAIVLQQGGVNSLSTSPINVSINLPLTHNGGYRIATRPACVAGMIGSITTFSDGVAYAATGAGSYGALVGTTTGAVTRQVMCTNTAGPTSYGWVYN